MTTDTWLALGLSLVLIAVIVESVVLAVIIHWLREGQKAASVWLDGLTRDSDRA